MDPAYFDTSVFLAIFNGEASGPGIRALLRELKRDKVRIYTSILTVQEVSVLSFRVGQAYDDNHAKVNKLARIQTITREIALTAAKLEAGVLDKQAKGDPIDNKRRKWDCFHIATAMQLGCGQLYSEDQGMLARKAHLSIKGVEFLAPLPRARDLFSEPPETSVQ